MKLQERLSETGQPFLFPARNKNAGFALCKPGV